MSSKNIFYSSDYANDEHVGLFDRIINIKFTRKNGETITLHSDYEPVWQAGKLNFITCQPKPEIRVTYTHHQGVMINVDIYVTNLNIQESASAKTKDAQVQASASMAAQTLRQGTTTNLPNDALFSEGNPITSAEIEMGYRGNFFNWSQYDRDAFTEEQAYMAFQNLESLKPKTSKISDSQALFKQHRRCRVTIEWATNISNPPDRVTQFHGFVGEISAGFQPFAQLTFDNPSEAENTACITRQNLFEGLDDPYDRIDNVPTARAGYEADDLSVVFSERGYTYRNFFNKGKGFTLLEALCFNLVTRRFVKSSVDVQRNPLLEEAALEYVLAADFGDAVNDARDKFVHDVEQKVYKKEQPYNRESFVLDGNSDLVYSDKISNSFKDYLDLTINELLANKFVGSRFTIKNLPDYRALYKAIRNTMDKALQAKNPISWWEALDKIESSEYKGKIPSDFESAEFKNTIASLREYTEKLQNGNLISAEKPIECFIKRTFNDDWIIPVENLQSSVLLKDNKNKDILVDGKAVPCFSGLFEVRDAYMFGVLVLCSTNASRKVAQALAGQALIETQFLSQAHNQIAWVCKTFGLLNYKFNNGGYFLYADDEDPRNLVSEAFITEQFKTPIVIPAVYDITISPIRIMRLPFISFLDPMSVLEWNSSTTIGTMVSFYYQPEKGRNFFLLISSKVDFATTGDKNEMELRLVDTEEVVDETVVPAALTKQEIEDGKNFLYTVVIIEINPETDSKIDTWRKIYESDITNIPFNLLNRWDETLTDENESYAIPKKTFFEVMSAWNPSLFALSTEAETGWATDDGSKRVNKVADWLYGGARPDKKVHFPDLEYCFTLSEIDAKLKRVYLRFPIMPYTTDYDKLNMEEVYPDRVMLYSQGVWSMQPKDLVAKKYNLEAV
jgi:hypothetical protein